MKKMPHREIRGMTYKTNRCGKKLTHTVDKIFLV